MEVTPVPVVGWVGQSAVSGEQWIVSRVPKERVPMEIQVILETVTEVDD